MYTNQTAKELAAAIKGIIKVEDGSLIVDSKENADTLSQLLIDAENEVCSVTGPFLQPVNNYPKRVWYVEVNNCPVFP